MNERIAVVIVTFNRKELFFECLDSVLNQTNSIDQIFVVDNNSSDGTYEDFKNNYFKEESIEYIRLSENTGASGGFHEGIKAAYEKGYDWVWLMDDDVEVDKDALSELLTYKELSKCIQPSRSILKNEIFYWDGYLDIETMHRVALFDSNFQSTKEYTYTNVGCFEGMLLHKSIIEKVGYPDKRFFIGYDDTMYGLKISRHTNILLTKKILMNKKINKKGYTSFSAYYFIRNLFLVKKMLDTDYPLQKKKRKVFFLIELLFLFKNTFRDLKFLDALSTIRKALRDAKNEKFYK